MADPARLDDAGVRERLNRLDALLEQVEQAPGPAAEAAIEAIQALTEVYGEALARVVDTAPPPMVERLAADELVGHLLVLHGSHPDPLPARVERALADIRPHVESQGGRIDLVDIDGATVRVRLSGVRRGCGSSVDVLEQAVTESVLAMAPELTGVELAHEPAPPALIAVDTLLVRTGRTP